MEFETLKSKVYIQTDDQGRILRCDGGYTTPSDLTGWTYIDEGTGDKYNLCQSNYFEGGLHTFDSIPRYKWDGTQALLRSDEEIEADRAAIVKPTPGPSQTDINKFMMMQAQDVTDGIALAVPTLYNVWEPGKHYGRDGDEKIVRVPSTSVFREDELYRCIQPHTSQADWKPVDTPALWVRINKSNAGTKDDPIPAARSMEYEYGLYYSDPEDGKIYLCTRTGEQEGTKVVLPYLPHELVGHYFKEVSE